MDGGPWWWALVLAGWFVIALFLGTGVGRRLRAVRERLEALVVEADAAGVPPP